MSVAGVVNGVCACRQRGACERPAKHPLIPGGTAGASTDPRQIDQWFSYWRTAGVGLLTGHRSGLAVVDLDPRHGGDTTLAQLREQWVRPPRDPHRRDRRRSLSRCEPACRSDLVHHR